MQFEKMTGKSFDSITKRMIYNYICSIPDLKTIVSSIATEENQKQMYDFLCSLYKTLYEHPEFLDLPIFPDETDGTPLPGRTYKDVRKNREPINRIIEGLFQALIDFGYNGEVKENRLVIYKKVDISGYKRVKKNSQLLNKAGFETEINDDFCYIYHERFPEMMAGLKLLALQVMSNSATNGVDMQRDRMYYFSMCIFDSENIYHCELFKRLSYFPENVQKLYDYLKDIGFVFEADRYKLKGCRKFGDLLVKCDISFRPEFKNQLSFSFMSDKVVIKDLLHNFSELNKDIQELLFTKINQCRGCGFCNQTNKKRPFNYIEAKYDGKDMKFCFHFQHIRYRDMSDEAIKNVINFYDFLGERYNEADPTVMR